MKLDLTRLLRILAITGVFILIFGAIVTSSIKPPNVPEKIWNENMVLGDPASATRHFVVYTDLMCPYCNYYAKLVQDNEEDAKTFFSEHKIAYEVRVTDMLNEGSGVEESLPAAEGAYCAAREGKFWDYYHHAVETLFSVYYEKGIGNSKTAPKIEDMDRSFWRNVGKDIGLGSSFKSCFDNQESVEEIKANTLRAAQAGANGLPTFVFDEFTTGGFDPTWDWSVVKEMYSAGL